MATVILKTGNNPGYGSIVLECDWSYTQDISNNRSTISLAMYLRVPSNTTVGPWNDGAGSYLGTTGNTFTGSIGSLGAGRHLVPNSSKSFTINHDAAGKGSATAYWKWGVNSSWGGFVTPSGSFAISVPDIPRQSAVSVSASSVNYGSALTISCARAVATYTHDLTISTPGRSTTVTGVGASTSWTLPSEWMNAIPNDEDALITISCVTKSGTTTIGSATTTSFTGLVPASVVPSVAISAPTLTQPSGLSGYASAVTTVTSVAYSRTATPAYSSAITTTAWSTTSYSSSATSFSFVPVQTSQTVSCTVTDTRGRSSTASVALSSMAYSKPQISGEAYRCGSTGVLSDSGTYIKFKPTLNFTSLGGANAITTLAYHINTATATTGSIASPVSGTTYPTTATAYGGGNVAVSTRYTLTLTATDKAGNSTSATAIIAAGYKLFHFKHNGAGKYGIGIGQYGGAADTLNVGFPTTFNSSVQKGSETLLVKSDLLNMIYPVGSVYISVTNTSPASFLGGTWEVFSTGRTLVGISTGETEFNTIEKTGGAKTHTLTAAEMPVHSHSGSSDSTGAHTHTQDPNTWMNDSAASDVRPSGTTGFYMGAGRKTYYTGSSGAHSHTITVGNAGSGGAHNNLQPYITVYMWKRTA